MPASTALAPGRWYGLGLVGFFVGCMTLSMALTSWTAARSDPTENRRLAAAPGWPRSAMDWTAWPTRFETFVNDNFGFRRALLRLDARIATGVLRQLITKNVVEGLDGWLYFAGDDALKLYTNERPLSVDDLDDWRDELARRRDWLAARGTDYVFTIAPDKHTIYPEFVPRRYWRRDRPSQIDQIVAMAQEAGLPVVDMRAALWAGKADGPVYLKHDTHWNEWGGYIGYRQIMAAIEARPGLDRFELRRSDMRVLDTSGGDLAIMAGLDLTEQAPSYDARLDRCHVETTIEPVPRGELFATRRLRCPSRNYKALIFRDSFAIAMARYFGQTFGESLLIWTEPTFDDLKAAVDREKPDVVIEERVERNVRDVPAHVSH